MANDINGGPNQVQAWREVRGLSREALAELLKASPKTVWALEAGTRQLTAKWLRKIGRALNATPTQLLDEKPLSEEPEHVPSNVVEIWRALPLDQRDQAVRVLETFARRG